MNHLLFIRSFKRQRMTVSLPADLVERVRDAAYWTPGSTMAGLITEALEGLLANRLAKLESGAKVNTAATEIFQSYDLDGDGFITREEWLGTDAVFDAIDRDQDGKITPEEMGSGLGAILQLATV